MHTLLNVVKVYSDVIISVGPGLFVIKAKSVC